LIRRILFLVIISSITTFAYLDRTNVFALDMGFGSTVDFGGRVFGDNYRPEWALRTSIGYGISPYITLSLRGSNLAQRPKHNTIGKALEGTDLAAYNARVQEWKTGETVIPTIFDPYYSERDISLVAQYHMGIGEIYCPFAELGGGVGFIRQAQNLTKPFLCGGLGHEFFIRPNLALDILGDVHYFPTYKIAPFASTHEPRNLLLVAISAGLRWYL
jgi:hypothetical protein